MIHITANQTGDAEKKRQFTLQIGTLSSALEHITPEQMFAPTDPNAPKPDAISAVKALQKASAAGQKIYQINQANMGQVLPLLNHDQITKDEIRRALNAGKDVTTHTDKVSIPGGWSGFGYIITDPVVGDGVYKISGGLNGSLLIFLVVMVMFIIAIYLAVITGAIGLLFFELFNFGVFVYGITKSNSPQDFMKNAVSAMLGTVVASAGPLVKSASLDIYLASWMTWLGLLITSLFGDKIT